MYSHIPTALVALFFGFFILLKVRSVVSVSLFWIIFFFALWCFLDLNTWFSFFGAGNTMFTWSLIDLTALLCFFFSYRFLYSFVHEQPLPVWQLISGLGLITPTIVTTALGMNLAGFDTLLCEAVENDWVVLYPYIPQTIFIFACLWLGVSSLRNTTYGRQKKEQIILATTGILLFLLFFFSANFIVTLLTTYTSFEGAYNLAIYGLFGMPILLMFLGYLIVRYQAFNIKMIAAQAIVTALVLIDASQVFFSTTRSEWVVNIITIFLVVVFGYYLTRSVKQEIAARERNEQLAKDLARANARLRELDRQKSEFVSIASHQLRSPLTSIRGYASMLQEGSFGKLPQKAVDVVGRIQESSTYMASSIEDFLNVSRIEQGKMKYENADVNIKDMAEKVVDDIRAIAIKKGLALMFRSQCEGSTLAYVDPGKMRQVIYNLVDNAIKYTPKGSVDVIVKDDLALKKIYVHVKDTGVGMDDDALHNVFDKFVRAKNANSINVTGSGLGLFVAKQMLEAMGGKVTVASDGEGKGSTFTVELSMVG